MSPCESQARFAAIVEDAEKWANFCGDAAYMGCAPEVYYPYSPLAQATRTGPTRTGSDVRLYRGCFRDTVRGSSEVRTNFPGYFAELKDRLFVHPDSSLDAP